MLLYSPSRQMTFYMLDLTLQMWNYSSYVYEEKNSQARAEGVKTLGIRNIKKKVQGVPVGQPIPIWAHARNPTADGIF